MGSVSDLKSLATSETETGEMIVVRIGDESEFLSEKEIDRDQRLVDEVEWIEYIDVYQIHDGQSWPEHRPHPVDPARWRGAGRSVLEDDVLAALRRLGFGRGRCGIRTDGAGVDLSRSLPPSNFNL